MHDTSPLTALDAHNILNMIEVALKVKSFGGVKEAIVVSGLVEKLFHIRNTPDGTLPEKVDG